MVKEVNSIMPQAEEGKGGKWTPEMKRQAEMADALRVLLKSEGWKVFCRLLDEQALDFHKQVLLPISEEAGVWRSEYAKGAVYGLTLAKEKPASIIAGIEATLPKGQEE